MTRTFEYRALSADGQPVVGTLTAESEKAAFRVLQERNLVPLELIAAIPAVRRGAGKQSSFEDRYLVLRELATLLHAGIPLAEAIHAIADAHGESEIGDCFHGVQQALRQGKVLSLALRESSLSLPEYAFQLVVAGELTGRLAPALHGVVDQMEYEEKIRQETRNALIYPGVLVVSGVLAVLFVFVFVAPKFAGLLKGSRVANIPAISVWVIGTGLFVKQHLLAVFMGVVTLLGAVVAGARTDGGRKTARLLLARLPILGNWIHDVEIGKWAATLSTLLGNRVPIVQAMELSQHGVSIDAVKGKLQSALRDIRAGKTLADALAAQNLLDPLGLNLVRVGERSGELPNMLRTFAGLRENAARNRIKRFLLLLEPLAILLIGSVIGFIMVAIMLAITSLSDISL